MIQSSLKTEKRLTIFDVVGSTGSPQVGDLPTILLELDPNDDMNIEKTYIYGNSQILCQHGGDHTASRRFYLNDRLGSVRLVIDESAGVLRGLTYGPFGDHLHEDGSSPLHVYRFMFTGQYYDSEIGQYYLRARQYDPYIGRFTSRDLVMGKFEEPMTLHKYLYCGNNPINFIDPDGKWAASIGLSWSANFTWGGFKPIKNAWGAAKSRLTLTGGLMDYYCILMPYYTASVDFMMDHSGLGGTAGGAFVVAHDTSKELTKGWSFGLMGYVAGGVSAATSGGKSLTVDFGVSPDAQHISHLEGPFKEFGGSLGTGVPFIPGLGINVGSLTLSIGKHEEVGQVRLFTGSLGWGSPGAEGHAFVGHTWVSPPLYEN